MKRDHDMPRQTYKSPRPNSASTYEDLRTLHLAVKLRAEQVKLRRLEWDTQPLALPHLTPLPGDTELQCRIPPTKDDLPAPKPPAKAPKFEPGMPTDIYRALLDTYLTMSKLETASNPYNWLASISAQERREAKEP